MKRLTYMTLALLLVFVTAGCRHSKEIVKSGEKEPIPEQPQPATKGDSVVVDSTAFKYMTANFDCTVNGFTAVGQLRMAYDSVMWVSVNMLIELGRAKLTRDSVFVMVKPMGRYFAGDYNDIAKVTGIYADYKSMQELFLGESSPKLRRWIRASYGDYRKIRARTLPFEILVGIRCKLLADDLKIKYKKVQFDEETTFPYSLPPSAKPFDTDDL